ncbi:MAG: tungsten ABC transporter substrate-binding protein [Alphaproteobacteria bacterium]|nr:MAG: tungsten ABC transporter substrate-binding protein [Alphaproteobacteria bacterium]
MTSLTLTRRLWLGVVAAAAAATLCASGIATADDRFITVASTTSTEDSGLFDHILPIFEAKTGIEVRVVAKGTGAAIKQASTGDADVLFVHDQKSEEKFVADGYGVERFPVMYNDFVLVGPKSDPAGIKGMSDIAQALKKIAAAQSAFTSRGDDSGTNKAELRLWEAAGIDAKAVSGSWYRETGQGMGPTLNTAAAMGAYALTDRGTWIAFENKSDLEIVVEGDDRLFNQYGVILVDPERFPHVKAADGQAFVDWLISPEGQQAIADFKLNGQQLFFPNYEAAS